MKILLFGKNGQVGWELNRSLQPLGEVIALGREDADFSNPESLRDKVRRIKPDVIVNAVAYTAVDKAEQEEQLALLINGVSPKVLAEEAYKINALLVHYSTDYVFDGEKMSAYVEDDKPSPINAYGRTKLTGEKLIQASGCKYLIFRTSWVYASRGHNFLLTILKLAKERDELNIISDQFGSPTSARLIAETTLLCLHRAIINKNQGGFSSGIYHLAASDKTSWYGFAELAIYLACGYPEYQKKVTLIKEITTEEYHSSALRPLNSNLATSKVINDFGVVFPNWKAGLELCIDELHSGSGYL